MVYGALATAVVMRFRMESIAVLLRLVAQVISEFAQRERALASSN